MNRCIMCMGPVSEQLTTHSRRHLCEQGECFNDFEAIDHEEANRRWFEMIEFARTHTKYRVREGNTIAIATDDDAEANEGMRILHEANPFVYHEKDVFRHGTYETVRQLEPGDDPVTGRTKWCWQRITEAEADNDKNAKCNECQELIKTSTLHCPWHVVSKW